MYRDADMADFARFEPAYPGAALLRRPFALWELGGSRTKPPWSRYLASPRAEADLACWRADLFAGAV